MSNTLQSRERYYANMFLAAAFYNWIIAAVFFFAYDPMFDLMQMDRPVYPVNLQLFLALGFAFGLGYYWVGRDIYRHYDIVRLGIVGKALVFGIILYYWLHGDVTVYFFLPALGDLVFAGLFAEFLMQARKVE